MLMRAESLYKTFGGGFHAIEDVSIEFEKGTLTSIIGPNGAGKTTLINLLSGSLSPDKGKIFFKQEPVEHLPVEKRVKRGICRSFQITNIFPDLTVFQNIQIPLIAYYGKNLKILSRLDLDQELRDKTFQMLKEVRLVSQKDIKASYLSHGEQRQLEIGIALATHPEIIFLDEPSQGMNKVEKASVMQNVARLSGEGKATFVIIEHDMDVVFGLSQRIVVLHSGKVIADGTPEAIRNDELVRNVYLGEDLWTSCG